METTTLVLLLLVPLLVWRIYSRLKLLMGRQLSQAWRHGAVATVLSAMLGLLAAAVLDQPLALGALALGGAGGAALGAWNMRLSRLENTPQGCYYTPNLHLGMLVSMLFISRLLYRGFELYLRMHDGTPLPPESFHRSPLTVLLFSLISGYYGCYHLLLLRWRRVQQAPPPGPLDGL